MIMVAACVASLTACGGDKVTKNQENTTAVTTATTQAAQESTTVQEETSSRSMEEARAAAEKVRQAKGQIDSEITNQENVGADGQADGTGSDTAGASDAAAVAQEAQEAQEAVAAAVSSSIGKDDQVVTVVDTVGVNSARAQYNANYAAYANSQYSIREQLQDGYVKLNTIRNEVNYMGYFNIKYKKLDHLIVTMTIDGEKFEFTY